MQSLTEGVGSYQTPWAGNVPERDTFYPKQVSGSIRLQMIQGTTHPEPTPLEHMGVDLSGLQVFVA